MDQYILPPPTIQHSAIAKIQLDVSECGKSKKCEYGGCTGKEAEPSTNSCAYLFTTMSEGQESVLMGKVGGGSIRSGLIRWKQTDQT